MDELVQAVRERAGYACEYCLLPAQDHPGEFFVEAVTFEIEHIIPRQHRGRTVLRNLAFSCLRCNKSKGPNLAGLDPHSGKLTPLFHPRRHKWTTISVWMAPTSWGAHPLAASQSMCLT